MPEHDTTENLDIETPAGHVDLDQINMSNEPEEEAEAEAPVNNSSFDDESRNSDNLPKSGDSEDSTGETPDEEPETFDRPYVEKLRREAAESRVKAKRADDLAAALWTARVTATGRLADPSDLVMPDDADPLDEDAVTTALDDLLERKPHLASRKPRGSVGQGATTGAEPVDLAALMRSRV